MTSRLRLTMLLCGFIFSLCGAPQIKAQPLPAGDAAYAQFADQARAADLLTDPLERCLKYPDPPGTHWNKATTEAYCRFRNTKFLTYEELSRLVTAGNAREVDRILQGYLDTQLRGPGNWGMFDAAYARLDFDHRDKAARKVIDAWRAQRPGSAFAIAASGWEHLGAAYRARGEGLASALTYEQVQGMNAQLSLARDDLSSTVSVNPKLTVAYIAMIVAGGLEGDLDYVNDSAKEGLTADPLSYRLRSVWLSRTQPRWGGIPASEDRQAAAAKALTSKNPLLGLVPSQLLVERLPEHPGDKQILGAVSEGASYSVLNDAADFAYSSSPHLAIELYSEVLRFDPSMTRAADSRIELLIASGDSDWAAQELKKRKSRTLQTN